ncbi:MAG: S8 family peptidase [Cyanobacteria bacterium]|nr:S8 family peptidase [Cyanobacteriota bacterium]MDW8202371.1 S8 family peptidase [Cyanobacteriota bacterium SKYGB_h_bin112]
MRRLLIVGLFVLGLVLAIAGYRGLKTQGDYDSIVVNFREPIAASVIQQQLTNLARGYGVQPHLNSVFSAADNIYVLPGDRSVLRSLRASPLAKHTEFIEPNYRYRVMEAPNDPDYPKQWNFRSINLEAAWDETRGSGVTVAVIDTGISPVPDLAKTKFVEGYDFVHDRPEATDDYGHGTHVAGTIAQSTNNNYGVAGIAYEASLMPLKVLDESGTGTIADIAEAIRFAADNGAQVINMSLGGGGESALMQEAINYAHSKGVVIVAAAGNANTNNASYPARYPHVIGVSALNAAGEKASYSNYGAGVDISAPGGSTDSGEAGGILQNTIDPETGNAIFAAFQGTSMAAPHVAGVAALVKAAGVSDPDQVTQVLTQSARKVADDGLNYYGAGQLDAAAAVKLATRGQLSIPDFFRWLRDNGYLNPVFWLDGGVVALLPKLAMVLGSYLLAWFLRNYFPFAWSWSLSTGLVLGSSGLFPLRGLYIFDLPQYPLRLLGSSIPELGTAIQGSSALNPLFASVLIPLGLVVLLLGHPQGKWFAIGTSIGIASCLMVSAVWVPHMVWLGNGLLARGFLAINALLCYGLAYLAAKPGHGGRFA